MLIAPLPCPQGMKCLDHYMMNLTGSLSSRTSASHAKARGSDPRPRSQQARLSPPA
jgi:hypothetical protein